MLYQLKCKGGSVLHPHSPEEAGDDGTGTSIPVGLKGKRSTLMGDFGPSLSLRLGCRTEGESAPKGMGKAAGAGVGILPRTCRCTVALDLDACSLGSAGTALVLGWAGCSYFRCTRNMTWDLGSRVSGSGRRSLAALYCAPTSCLLCAPLHPLPPETPGLCPVPGWCDTDLA